MTTPTMHPLLKLQAVVDQARGHLATLQPRPVLATATTAHMALAIDAWGLLAGLEIAEPTPDAPTLNEAFAMTIRAAQRALRLEPARRPGLQVRVRTDRRRPFPSWLERMGPGSAVGFDAEHAARVIAPLQGEARSGTVRAAVRPGGALVSLHVDSTAGLTAGEVVRDVQLAVRRAAEDVAGQVATSSLDPTWAFTRMLLDNPYPTPQES